MKIRLTRLQVTTLIFFTIAVCGFSKRSVIGNDDYVSLIVDPRKQELKFYWKNDKQEIFKSIGRLKSWVETKKKSLVFAMNGGMYKEDNSPLGLYIENGKTLFGLNNANAQGNFYLKPNGVFFLTRNNEPKITKSESFKASSNIQYATQSGPMLIIDGKVHPAFTPGSTNTNIRNGVGILPGNRILFAMSKSPVNFYDFALYFKNMGCTNALYLDGFVSRTYLPEQNWIQTDGNFGVIIAITKSN